MLTVVKRMSFGCSLGEKLRRLARTDLLAASLSLAESSVAIWWYKFQNHRPIQVALEVSRRRVPCRMRKQNVRAPARASEQLVDLIQPDVIVVS